MDVSANRTKNKIAHRKLLPGSLLCSLKRQSAPHSEAWRHCNRRRHHHGPQGQVLPSQGCPPPLTPSSVLPCYNLPVSPEVPTTTGPSLDVNAVVGVKRRVYVEAAMFLKGQGVARTLAQRAESPLANAEPTERPNSQLLREVFFCMCTPAYV